MEVLNFKTLENYSIENKKCLVDISANKESTLHPSFDALAKKYQLNKTYGYSSEVQYNKKGLGLRYLTLSDIVDKTKIVTHRIEIMGDSQGIQEISNDLKKLFECPVSELKKLKINLNQK